MKNQSNKIILFLISIMVFCNANGQIYNIAKMVVGSTSDGEKLLQAYIKPYANAFGADLNAAWYSTAKPHKLLGFDLTASVSAAFVPSADKVFDASKLGLSAGASVSPLNSMSQTAAGKHVAA